MNTKETGSRYEEIIRNSARLFREKGFPATSIRDIGDSMAITSAALYYHFKNKDEVLLGIMQQGLVLVNKAVVRATQSEQDTLSQLKAAVRAHLQVSLENQDFAAVLLQDVRHLRPDSRKLVVQQRDAYEKVWADLLERAAPEGVLRAGLDLHLLRLMILGTLNLVVGWYRPEWEYNAVHIADTYFDYIFNGITEGHHA